MAGTEHYSIGRIKKGLQHFALGRAVNGAGGLIFLFLAVQGLAPVEYGNYIAFLAGLDLIALASSFGVFGFAQRYFPEFRIKGSSELLQRSLLTCLGIRAMTLLVAAAAVLQAQDALARLFGISAGPLAFRIFAAWLVVEGVCRWLDNVAESLLLQAATQASAFIRIWVKVLGIGALAFASGFTIDQLLIFELAGSALALVFTLLWLFRAMSRTRGAPDPDYRPDWKTIIHFSRQHYLALLFAQVYGYSALKLLLSALAGPVVTAVYGFAQSLADIVRRYLPVQLLLGLVRPLIVASYAEGKNVERPIFLSNLVFKLNVFLIAPVTATAVVFGPALIELVHQGKYPGAYPILIALLLLLVFQTLHIVLSMLAMSLERGNLILRGTTAALTGVVAAAALIPHLGAYGAVVGAAVSELVYCLVVVRGIRLEYHRPVALWRGHLRMWALAGVAAALAWGATASIMTHGAVAAVVGSLLVAALYFLFALHWRPFSSEQRTVLNRVLPRPVFVW